MPRDARTAGSRFFGRERHPAGTGSASLPADDALVSAMDRAREVASATLGLRKAQNLRVSQPLRRLTVVTDDVEALGAFTGVVADEVNVKEVRLLGLGGPEAAEVGVAQRLTVNARTAGPRLGRDVQAAFTFVLAEVKGHCGIAH